MNDQFDELAKNMAQSVTRRGALKKFGVGLAAIALASLGLANKAQAGRHNPSHECKKACDNCRGYPWGCSPDANYEYCILNCASCCQIV